MRAFLPCALGTGVAIALLAAAPVAQSFGRHENWNANERAVIASMRLSQLPPVPLDPSNAVDGRPDAIALGRRLFNDPRFSRNQQVSCASCHSPQKQFQDGLAVGRGVGIGSRRTMSIVGAASGSWQFWDGRKDSLWSQALGPLEDPDEHGGNRARDAQLMQAHYRREYEAIFGPIRMQSADHLNRVFANMGKAIAAYEKTVRHGPSRFDRYAEHVAGGEPSDTDTLSPAAVNGLRLFIGKGQCVSCHGGPLLSDQAFHNTGAPSSVADRGRAAGIEKVLRDEFNCLGRYSDARPGQCGELNFVAAGDPSMEGAFKTPSLRNVAERPPYMHAGQLASLRQAIAHYVRAPAAVVGRTELGGPGRDHTARAPIRLSAAEIDELASFLGTLSGPVVEAPADEERHE